MPRGGRRPGARRKKGSGKGGKYTLRIVVNMSPIDHATISALATNLKITVSEAYRRGVQMFIDTYGR